MRRDEAQCEHADPACDRCLRWEQGAVYEHSRRTGVHARARAQREKAKRRRKR